MNDSVAEIFDWVQSWYGLAFVVFLRVGAAMALFPAFGERSVPERVRLVLALSFTLVVLPVVAPEIRPIVENVSSPATLIFTEAVSGLAIGATVRLVVIALQIAGAMAAQATSLAQVFGGMGVDPQPAIGHVLLTAGLALAVMMGLHLRLAELLITSYELFPPGDLPGAEFISSWGLENVAHAFSLAFSLAAPFVVASLIYNVALGAINRAMPQLMVAFVGAPAITAGALLLLFLTAPLLLSLWRSALSAFFAGFPGGI